MRKAGKLSFDFSVVNLERKEEKCRGQRIVGTVQFDD